MTTFNAIPDEQAAHSHHGAPRQYAKDAEE
jgi:hypothetical protein